jgi:hypothetical protein
VHGMSVVDEIQDFKERLSRAREMLSVSSLSFGDSYGTNK